MKITEKYTLSIETRLFNAGKDEFGNDYEAESYHIMAKHDSGRIWYHPVPFLGVIVYFNEIWEFDRNRIELLKSGGYDVIVVWESEYKSDKEGVIGKIMKYVKGE